MPEKVRKILATISYSELQSLIFILQDQAATYHDLDDYPNDLTLDQFTEWLSTMKGEVELFEVDYRQKVQP